MVRITLIEQTGYREWTETLGSDREWIIQSLQAKLYSELQATVSRLGGYLLPLRHDYLLAITTGLGKEAHEKILDMARLLTGRPIRMASVAHTEPREALERAFQIIPNTQLGGLSFMEGHDGLTAVGHVDINGITIRTREKGISESLLLIAKTIHDVARISLERGGIPQYLGGDNIIVVLPDEGYEEIAEKIAESELLKVGVGVSFYPRKAMELATAALDEIRENRGAGAVRVKVG